MSTPGSAGPQVRVALLLSALIALGPITIDMYLPALPHLVEVMGTTSSAIQLTLAGTLVGLALGQLFIGPLTDAVGRRRPLLAGVALHIVTSLLIVLSPNVVVLGVLRVLQGVGAAAGAVIAMAVVRDLYTGRAAAALLSRLMLVLGVAPVLAPTLGAGVLRIADWRGVFVALAVIGLALLLLLAAGLRETLPPERRRSAALVPTLRAYGALFRDRSYVGLTLVTGLAIAGLFGYVAGASFVFQEQFGFDAQQFGLLFGAGAISLIISTQLNAVLLRRFEPSTLLLAASIIGTVAGAALAVLAWTGTFGLLGVLVPLWLVLGSAGLMLPNAPALALARHGERAGTAAAMLGAAQFGIGALTSPLIGLLGNDAFAMGVMIAISQALALAVLLAVVRPWQLGIEDHDAPADLPEQVAATGEDPAAA